MVMIKRRKMRERTKREIEASKIPVCPHDQLSHTWCTHYIFPPDIKICERCIVGFITEGLERDEPSEAMRWFIVYRNLFYKKNKTISDNSDDSDNSNVNKANTVCNNP